MKVKAFWAWYDFWVGFFWDGKKRALYICVLPTLVIKIWRESPNEGLEVGE